MTPTNTLGCFFMMIKTALNFKESYINCYFLESFLTGAIIYLVEHEEEEQYF